jgi:catechol 2,3-dioxygenase-like lactoylglutathione lyase family enzyme
MLQFDHVRLDVVDIERAQSFYQAALGLLPFVRYTIPGGVILQMGINGLPPGVELWMENTVQVAPHPTQHIAFAAKNVIEVVEHIRHLGYEIIREPVLLGEESVAFVCDPDGHIIEINDFKGRKSPKDTA